jgi:phosphatidylserine/phosphatidylglycerophosphate/cardiolipin synthase-like enzyme
VLNKLGITSVLAALVVALVPAPAHAWAPEQGALFNNPWGGDQAKNRLLKKITRTINATPSGSTIRIAAYSNDRKDVTDALIKAHRRKVDVRVLLNGNWTSKQTTRMQRVLGKDRGKRSFVHICKYSCRGKRGNLHSKFYLFTKAGSAEHVVMFGSVNLTGYGAKTQWNDLYTTNNRKVMHNFLRDVFEQMKRDRAVRKPYISRAIADWDLNVYPRYNTAKREDPVWKRLNRVRCKGATNGTGVDGRTMIMVNMYGWNGERGVYLARKMADLSRNGCRVRVLQSAGGGKAMHILRNNGVKVKSPSYDRNNNGQIDVFTHAKYMALSGRMLKKSGWHVWTGSQNWSDRSFNGDELTVHMPRRGAFWDYRQNFDYIWKNHAHR